MSLPTLAPPSLRGLWSFDLRWGLPLAARVLHRHLGTWRTLGVLLRYGLGRDPLRTLPPPADARERMTRHQLAQVTRLDRAIRGVVTGEQAMTILRDVVGASGARFIALQQRGVGMADWVGATADQRERYARSLNDRFFNAVAEGLQVDAGSIRFDIVRCDFARLCGQLGRPELGPVFCHADAVYFGSTDSPITLERAGTLAEGACCCDFALRWRETPTAAEE